MRINAKSGVVITGQTTKNIKDPRPMGEKGNMKLEFSVMYGQTQNESGNWVNNYIDVAVWGLNASKYHLRPHQDVIVSGRITNRKYTDKSGNEQTKEELIADAIIANCGEVDVFIGAAAGALDDVE